MINCALGDELSPQTATRTRVPGSVRRERGSPALGASPCGAEGFTRIPYHLSHRYAKVKTRTFAARARFVANSMPLWGERDIPRHCPEESRRFSRTFANVAEPPRRLGMTLSPCRRTWKDHACEHRGDARWIGYGTMPIWKTALSRDPIPGLLEPEVPVRLPQA